MRKQIIVMGIIMSVLVISGCKLSEQEREDFEREYKRHKEQQEEPYIPVPEI